MSMFKTITVQAPRAVQWLNMPRAPWIDLDGDAGYAWSAALGSAIGSARHGITTVLLDADGNAVAQIGPSKEGKR